MENMTPDFSKYFNSRNGRRPRVLFVRAALGALPSAAPFGESGGATFRILAVEFLVKADLGPIWDRFGGGQQSGFECRILTKKCKSDVNMMKMRNRQTHTFANKSVKK